MNFYGYPTDSSQTVSAMTTFLLLMTLHPEVQKKAQAEIDQVAIDRLPTLDDYDSLPYTKALVKETLRWSPVVPLGIHRISTRFIFTDGLKACRIG